MSSEISTTSYASRRKELLALVNQLRAVGAQGDLDLPRITIIGNQSAGKSSVVEAISGISLPRDAGTCTRCPIECRLSSTSGRWSCRISIREEYNEQGERLVEIKEIPFGGVIVDKSEVEPALRRAQFAVLNPKVHRGAILSSTLKQLPSLITSTSTKANSFSRNIVCVDLEGPDLTDLSFIDLPGLIQNAPEEETISLVEDLVLSHLEGNCLILVALPMTDDIENQKALRLARQVDPTGKRTIGVMTKPDMLGPGSRKALELWLDVIEGRRHPLTHGYYCTRQPNDEERSEQMSSERARQLEETFFKGTAPWSKSAHSYRFGTANLSKALSRHLIKIIDDSLPGIKEETSKQLENCREGLRKLPTPIEEEPATYILNEVIAFCSEFHQFVKGGSGANARLIQDHRRAYEIFKLDIRKSAPNFIPYTDQEEKALVTIEEPDRMVSDQERFNLTKMRRHIKEAITRELPNNVPFEAKITLIKGFQKTWHESIDICFTTVSQSTTSLLNDLIKQHFARHARLHTDISNFVSELKQQFYESCLVFLTSALKVEESPFTQNTHYLQTATDKWHTRYRMLRTEKDQEPEADPVGTQKRPRDDPMDIDRPEKMARSSATPRSQPTPPSSSGSSSNSATPPQQPFRFGLASTFAFNPEPVTPVAGESEVAVKLSNAQRGLTQEDVNEIMSTLAKHGFTGFTVDDLEKLNPTDEYEIEIQVMAEVRGYFQVAYKRVIDNVPGFIDLQFLKGLGERLQPHIVKQLGLGTANANERCARYLAEDPTVVARRDELMARQKRLESVQRELSNFELRLDY